MGILKKLFKRKQDQYSALTNNSSREIVKNDNNINDNGKEQPIETTNDKSKDLDIGKGMEKKKIKRLKRNKRQMKKPNKSKIPQTPQTVKISSKSQTDATNA